MDIESGRHAEKLPREFSVSNAYPNPFNPTVTIPFRLPQAGEVSFAVFSILGQQVFSRTQTCQAGMHSFVFDAVEVGDIPVSDNGHGLVSGVYFLQVQFNGQVNTQKIMLLR